MLSLEEKVLAAIESAGGALRFDHFMTLVLYDSDFGYYASNTHQFGGQGDFITAPQVTPLFGTCIGRACAALLASLGPQTAIVEYGGGDGQLMSQILDHLSKSDMLPAHYTAIESSPALAALQQSRWAATPHPCTLSWEAVPPSADTAIIIANELWDAMPVRCFEITANGIAERVVCAQDGRISWGLIPAPIDLRVAVEALEAQRGAPFERGYHSEIWLGAQGWLEAAFAPYNKAILISIDYGFPAQTFYHPDRKMGTLMCHYQHHAHTDPFIQLGTQDITTHVDFSAIAIAAESLGLSIAGFCPQAAFLLSNGLLENLPSPLPYPMQQALHILTSPNEMGELIKVIAISKNISGDIEIPGFGIINHLHHL